ncbi:AMP-binding protein, partial [Streptomyces anulatus]
MTTSATSPWSLRPIPADTPPGRTAVPATDTSTLYGLLHRAERLHPHRPAVTDHARVITYAELGAAAGRVAAGLRQAGIGPGDRVAILGRRDSRLFVLLHGVLRAGAAVVTLDTA